jgi:hypothetical protein
MLKIFSKICQTLHITSAKNIHVAVSAAAQWPVGADMKLPTVNSKIN